jgi:hypothetical protein
MLGFFLLLNDLHAHNHLDIDLVAFLNNALPLAVLIKDGDMHQAFNTALLEITESSAHSMLAVAIQADVSQDGYLAAALQAYLKVKDVSPRDPDEVELLNTLRCTTQEITVDRMRGLSDCDPTASKIYHDGFKLLQTLNADKSLPVGATTSHFGHKEFANFLEKAANFFGVAARLAEANASRKDQDMKHSQTAYLLGRSSWSQACTSKKAWPDGLDSFVKTVTALARTIEVNMAVVLADYGTNLLSGLHKGLHQKLEVVLGVGGGGGNKGEHWAVDIPRDETCTTECIVAAFESSMGKSGFDGACIDRVVL